MRRRSFLQSFCLTLLLLMMMGSLITISAQADILATGNIWPETDPGTWASQWVRIGDTGNGTLSINTGSSVTTSGNIIGNRVGSTGVVAIDGSDSSLITKENLVGYKGKGSLVITNGGSVTDEDGTLGFFSGSTGTVTVDGTGSSWTSNGNGTSVGYSGEGILNITNGGLVEITTGTILGSAGGSGTVRIDGSDSKLNNDYFSVGQNMGEGYLSITNGGSMTSDFSRIGDQENTMGVINVDGEGSSWTNNKSLYLGDDGNGTLNITNGGEVTAGTWAGIANKLTSNGTVSVNGMGSTFTVTEGSQSYHGQLRVGEDSGGIGILSVTDGGKVDAAKSVFIGNSSIVNSDIGKGSSLNVGLADNSWNGTITNNGTIRLVADATVDSGTYTPMAYGTMNGSGIVQTFGGKWDAAAHEMIVADAVTGQGSGGASVSLDLSDEQKAIITDSLTGRSVFAGFVGTTFSTPMSFTATIVSDDALSALESLLPEAGCQVFSAWEFSTSGYMVSEDRPVSLSLWADLAKDIQEITIWHLMDDVWSKADISNLTFDGTYASFIADSFSGYAVTGLSADPPSVPEPATLLLFGFGLLGLAGVNRRKK